MNDKIKLNSRWFALTADNHKGVEHTVMQVSSEEEEGGVLTEREIITWSNLNDTAHGDGRTWKGSESQFLKLFKFIGFEKK
jgi:hypothetical protein